MAVLLSLQHLYQAPSTYSAALVAIMMRFQPTSSGRSLINHYPSFLVSSSPSLVMRFSSFHG